MAVSSEALAALALDTLAVNGWNDLETRRPGVPWDAPAPTREHVATVALDQLSRELGRRAEREPELVERLRAFTPRVAKHRIFVWTAAPTLPDSRLAVITRDDDYTIGVLPSSPHEIWSLALGSRFESRPCYTPSAGCETFPFPRPSPEQSEAIADAAAELDRLREGWLNPPGLTGCRTSIPHPHQPVQRAPDLGRGRARTPGR